jgi:hypothetical protein
MLLEIFSEIQDLSYACAFSGVSMMITVKNRKIRFGASFTILKG